MVGVNTFPQACHYASNEVISETAGMRRGSMVNRVRAASYELSATSYELITRSPLFMHSCRKHEEIPRQGAVGWEGCGGPTLPRDDMSILVCSSERWVRHTSPGWYVWAGKAAGTLYFSGMAAPSYLWIKPKPGSLQVSIQAEAKAGNREHCA